MDCKCLKCGKLFMLSEGEAAHYSQFVEKKGVVPPADVVGICPKCWDSDPADLAVLTPAISGAAMSGDLFRIESRLAQVTAGKLSGAAAGQVIADAGRAVAKTQQAFLRALDMTLRAEAAERARSPSLAKSATSAAPVECHRGIAIYSFNVGVKRPDRGTANRLERFLCHVGKTTVMSCTLDGMKSMIDSATR